MEPLWTDGLHRFFNGVGLRDYFGCRTRANDPDDPLVRAMITICVKNEEIRVEVSHVAFHGSLELFRAETSDSHVANDELRTQIRSAQVLLCEISPVRRGQRLSVEQHAQNLRLRSRARANDCEGARQSSRRAVANYHPIRQLAVYHKPCKKRCHDGN